MGIPSNWINKLETRIVRREIKFGNERTLQNCHIHLSKITTMQVVEVSLELKTSKM